MRNKSVENDLNDDGVIVLDVFIAVNALLGRPRVAMRSASTGGLPAIHLTFGRLLRASVTTRVLHVDAIAVVSVFGGVKVLAKCGLAVVLGISVAFEWWDRLGLLQGEGRSKKNEHGDAGAKDFHFTFLQPGRRSFSPLKVFSFSLCFTFRSFRDACGNLLERRKARLLFFPIPAGHSSWLW